MKRTAFALVVLYATVVSGLPLPIAQKVTGQLTRFPCEGASCGCASASQCWKSCCCSTLEEKIAWARKHGVAVPAEAQRRAEPLRSCCVASEIKGACGTTSRAPQQKNAVAKRGCCLKVSDKFTDTRVETGETSTPSTISLIAALGCGGQSDGAVGVIPSLPPATSSHPLRSGMENSCHMGCNLTSCFSLPPATPPPQCG